MTDQDTSVSLAPHGARWSDQLAHRVAGALAPLLPPGSLVWDMCAGTGRHFHEVIGPECGWVTMGSELEPEWANWSPWRHDLATLADDGWPDPEQLLALTGPAALGTLVADSTTIPYRFLGRLHGACTSLVFDNRMNDNHLGLSDYERHGKVRDDGSTVVALREYNTPEGKVLRPRRGNYTAQLGRPLHSRNAARYRGTQWRQLTEQLVTAAVRATRPGGIVAMEMKDALEDNGATREWNVDWLLGFCTRGTLHARVATVVPLAVPGRRDGANRHRVADSHLIVLEVIG